MSLSEIAYAIHINMFYGIEYFKLQTDINVNPINVPNSLKTVSYLNSFPAIPPYVPDRVLGRRAAPNKGSPDRSARLWVRRESISTDLKLLTNFPRNDVRRSYFA